MTEHPPLNRPGLQHLYETVHEPLTFLPITGPVPQPLVVDLRHKLQLHHQQLARLQLDIVELGVQLRLLRLAALFAVGGLAALLVLTVLERLS